jgi:amino-acid N-acetyltransferase
LVNTTIQHIHNVLRIKNTLLIDGRLRFFMFAQVNFAAFDCPTLRAPGVVPRGSQNLSNKSSISVSLSRKCINAPSQKKTQNHYPGRVQANSGFPEHKATAAPALEAIEKTDYSKFVRFLHLASPYVAGHRSRTFVIVLPGEVVMRRDRLARFLEDILLLHGLGVRLVLVAGAKELIDQALRESGRDPGWEGAYRITDQDVMKIALETAGCISTEISAQLSRAPSIPMMRRHSRGEGGRFHFAPAVQVVSGNFVTAKRRGIVNGKDFGFMGQVRFVQKEALRTQLDADNIVLLNNVGVSAAGELLNCNVYDVATHAAVELQADKLLCLTGSDVRQLKLPHYLPLDDAEELVRAVTACQNEEECVQRSLDEIHISREVNSAGSTYKTSGGSGSNSTTFDLHTGAEYDGQVYEDGNNGGNWSSQFWHEFPSSSPSYTNGNVYSKSNGNGGDNGSSQNSTSSTTVASSSSSSEMLFDLDSWQQIGFPNAVLAAVVACRQGVNRAHLIDLEHDGAMLLELYTRDGITGVTMVAADLYEGIRPAEVQDMTGITRLLSLFTADGHQLPHPLESCGDHLGRITVLAREGRVLACAWCSDLGEAPDGKRTAEISAFIVEPNFRRQGLGDSLLDYVEQGLRKQGFRRVVLIAGQGSFEWFGQRSFEVAGDAWSSELIPKRRAENAPSVAKLFVKEILELDASLDAPAGKRIGF